MITTPRAIALVLAMSASSSSMAYFDVVEEDVSTPVKPVSKQVKSATPAPKVYVSTAKKPVAPVVKQSSQLSKSNTKTLDAPMRKPVELIGKAHDVSVQDSLLMIVPKGWKARVDPDARAKKSSWQTTKGDTWVDALNQVSDSSGVEFTLDWTNQIIAGSLDKVEPVVSTTKAKVTKPVMVWRIEPGSMRKQMEAWMDKAGYQNLQWDIEGDYILQSKTSYTGDLSAALIDFGKTLRANGVPVFIEEYGNKVVRVKEVN
jgi:hypothetical protein